MQKTSNATVSKKSIQDEEDMYQEQEKWDDAWDDAWDEFTAECSYKGQKPLVVFAKYIHLINKDLGDDMEDLITRLTVEEINGLLSKLTGKK